MSRKRKKEHPSSGSKKQENGFRFEVSKQFLAGVVIVITTALATILAQWVIDNYVSPAEPIIDVIEIKPPEDEGELAMLALIAASPFVGRNEQNRFIIEGLEPYDQGALPQSNIPTIDIPIQLVNTGDKATTANSFHLTFYTSPFVLTAQGYPLGQETQSVALEVGESKNVVLRFDFNGLQELDMDAIPTMPFTIELNNPEAERILQLVIGDIEGNRFEIPIQIQLIQNHPDHKQVSWVSGIEGPDKPKFYVRVIILDYFSPQSNPVFADNYAQLGDINYRQGFYENAIVAQTIAITLDNQQPDYYFKRGNAFDEQDKLDQAIADYERTVELDPENWKAWSNLGYVYLKQEDHTKAEEAFLAGIAVTKEEAFLYKNLGAAYILADQYEKAIEALIRASLLAPTDPETYYFLSVAYEGVNDSDKANASMVQAAQFGWNGENGGETSYSKYK